MSTPVSLRNRRFELNSNELYLPGSPGYQQADEQLYGEVGAPDKKEDDDLDADEDEE